MRIGHGHYECDSEGCEKRMWVGKGIWTTVSMQVKPQNKVGDTVTRHYCGECAAKRGIMLDDEGRFIMGKELITLAKERIYEVLDGVEELLKQSRRVKVGDCVTWDHKPYSHPTFKASGTVVKIYETTMGGQKKQMVAKIRVHTGEWWEKIGKETTVISLHKLEVFK